jgi:ectoine hydroxylase-related dioxygenase (phytanoyl-CoA dioxygenase family)
MEDLGPRLREIEIRGYTIFEEALSGDTVDALREEMERLYARQAEITGRPWGPERGLENLTNKSHRFLDAIEAASPVLALVEALLGPHFVLASLNARSSQAHTPAQGLHQDHQGPLLYERAPEGALRPAYLYVQSLWLLDDMTPERGATRIVPGTHTPEAGPPRAGSPYGEPVPLIARAGAAVVFPASLWHAGGEHTGPGVRRVMHGFFSRGFCMPQFDNLRSMPPDLLARCTPLQRRLLGYDRQVAWEEGWGDWRLYELPGIPSRRVWEQ